MLSTQSHQCKHRQKIVLLLLKKYFLLYNVGAHWCVVWYPVWPSNTTRDRLSLVNPMIQTFRLRLTMFLQLFIAHEVSLSLRCRYRCTDSTRRQRNPELSPRIYVDVSVSALISVFNICQTLNNKKLSRFCSSCEQFFNLLCCRPKLTKTHSDDIPI